MGPVRIGRNRFLVLGRAGMDLYADPPGTRSEEARQFSAALGGSAANIAVGIARLGGVASLISAVSDDAIGRFTVNELRRYGVGSDHVRVVGGEARNSLAVVETRLENCQSVIFRNGAADFQIGADQVRAVPYGDFGALIITGTSLAVEPSRSASFLAMELAGKAGLPIILDIDYRPYSWSSAENAARICSAAAALCEAVVGNDEEFAMMAGGAGDGLALASHLATSTASIVIYKMGDRGAITFQRDGSFRTGVFRVAALKPTGAGDAFMGALVTSLAAGFDIRQAVLRGSAAAAIVVTRVGCAPAMPTPEELDQFIATQPHPT